HGELGGVVDTADTGGEETRHRGGVHHVAAPSSADHARHESHDAVDRAGEIDSHDPVPVVVARFLDGLKEIDAGVVEQEGHDAEFRLHRFRSACQILSRGHIHLHPHGARVVERLKRRVDGVAADVGDGNVAALREERAHQPDTDAVGAAGDECRTACEVLHVWSFLWRWRAVSAAWIGFRNRNLKVRLYSSFSGRSGTAAHMAWARSSMPCGSSSPRMHSIMATTAPLEVP